ncbi:MAG: hypothetical protein AAFW97_14390 [Pseudomonadota bacterium]
MINQIDTQSLMALSEQQLLGLYETLNAEIGAMQPGSENARITAETINRVLNVIHHKRRQRRPSFPRPGR